MISLTSTAHGLALRWRQGSSRANCAYQLASSSLAPSLACSLAGACRDIVGQCCQARSGLRRGPDCLKETARTDDRLDSHWMRPHRADDQGVQVSVAPSASSAAAASTPSAPGADAPSGAVNPLANDQHVATVVLVDDSGVERRFLRSILGTDPGLLVVGEARTGRDALALVERLRPSAVVLDLELAGMAAIEIIERIMASVPTPILVCSTKGDAERAAAALAAGAVDVVARPMTSDADRTLYGDAVLRGVRVASRVRVITHPRARLKNRASAAAAAADATATSATPALAGSADRRPEPTVSEGTVDLVVIGASTGGPQALAHLLGALPIGFAPAIVVVQHMADGFIEGLASWLDTLCALPVAIATDGCRLRGGTVTIAPGARNLIVNDHLRISFEPP